MIISNWNYYLFHKRWYCRWHDSLHTQFLKVLFVGKILSVPYTERKKYISMSCNNSLHPIILRAILHLYIVLTGSIAFYVTYNAVLTSPTAMWSWDVFIEPDSFNAKPITKIFSNVITSKSRLIIWSPVIITDCIGFYIAQLKFTIRVRVRLLASGFVVKPIVSTGPSTIQHSCSGKLMWAIYKVGF